MPIIQISMLEGRSVAQKRSLIASVTKAVCESLGADPKSVRIMINELDPEHFAVSGITVGEQPLSARQAPKDPGSS
jgi:4-oxalocrotonate tautomerase